MKYISNVFLLCSLNVPTILLFKDYIPMRSTEGAAQVSPTADAVYAGAKLLYRAKLRGVA
jgi:hypothetical protein